MRVFSILFSLLFSLSINATEFTLTSYNLGLAHTFVPLAKERRPLIIEALKNESADVLCLQEVWTKKDQKKVIKSLKNQYPFVHISPTKQLHSAKRGVCKYNDLFGPEKFVSCMQTKCKGKTEDDLTSCIINDCRKPMDDLKDSNKVCAQALMAQVGKNKIIAILTLLNPLAKPGLFTYKGAIGTIILSKHPFIKKKTGFESWAKFSTTTQRGLLYATISKESKEVFVSCNHISANLESTVPYTGPFGSWADENLYQAQRTIDLANSIAPQSAQFISGDFNCSFKSENVFGEFEKSCHKFPAQGYATPIAVGADQCTFCHENTLIANDQVNWLLDHIFTKNVKKALSTGVKYKDTVILETKDGQVESNLSDHFGVTLRVEL